MVMGGLSLDLDEPTEQTIMVEEVIVHENYLETQSAVYNDISNHVSVTLCRKFVPIISPIFLITFLYILPFTRPLYLNSSQVC